MAIKPLKNRILIEQVKSDLVTTDTGIILGEERAPQSIKATVIAVGEECSLVKANDVIFISQYSPTECREKATDKTLIATEDDVLAIVA